MDTEEYKRRSQFNDEMKTMDKNSFVEIARILKKHGISVSENRSGLFFDLAKIPQEAFEDLVKFREFVLQNTKELESRALPSRSKA